MRVIAGQQDQPVQRCSNKKIATNKMPRACAGKRYYADVKVVDEVEQLAIDRGEDRRGARSCERRSAPARRPRRRGHDHVKPGDTFLGMDLSNGGHLNAWVARELLRKLHHPVSYKVNDEGLIDYEQMRALALEVRPKMVIAGYSAYSRVIDFARFADVAREVGAIFMVDMAHFAGLVAAGVYPSPVPHADIVTTTTHKTLRGPRGGLILSCKAEQHAKAIDKAVFPGLQGGRLEHVIGEGSGTEEALHLVRSAERRRRSVLNARAPRRADRERGFNVVSWRAIDDLNAGGPGDKGSRYGVADTC